MEKLVKVCEFMKDDPSHYDYAEYQEVIITFIDTEDEDED